MTSPHQSTLEIKGTTNTLLFATTKWCHLLRLLQTIGFLSGLLSKLSIIPWARAGERCLTAPPRKAGLGQTHTPSTPAIPPQEQKRECREPDHSSRTNRTQTICSSFMSRWTFVLQFLFLPGEFKLSGESTQLTGGYTDRKAVQHSITSEISGRHSCITHRISHHCSSTHFMLPSPHLMATPASAPNTPL